MSEEAKSVEEPRIVTQHKVASVAFLATEDADAGPWVLVKPENVPAFCKSPDVLGNLLENPDECVQDTEVDPRFFRAIRVDDPRLPGNQIQKPRIIVPGGLH